MSSRTPTFVINPKTKRKIMVGSTVYNKLVRDGLIQIADPPSQNEQKRTELYKAAGMKLPKQDKKNTQRLTNSISIESTSAAAGRIVARFHHLFTEDMSEDEIAAIVQRLTLQELVDKQPSRPRKALGLRKRAVVIESEEEDEDEESNDE
jgi:hypothetical protein